MLIANSRLSCVLLVVIAFCQTSAAAAERAKAALEETSTCKFVSMPLKDVAVFFSEKHNVKVVVKEGTKNDVPVTGEFKNQKLRDVLHELLTTLKLAYSADADEIVIAPAK